MFRGLKDLERRVLHMDEQNHRVLATSLERRLGYNRSNMPHDLWLVFERRVCAEDEGRASSAVESVPLRSRILHLCIFQQRKSHIVPRFRERGWLWKPVGVSFDALVLQLSPVHAIPVNVGAIIRIYIVFSKAIWSVSCVGRNPRLFKPQSLLRPDKGYRVV